MQAEAFAKLNLSLRVRPRDATGLHPLLSLMQSVDWADVVRLEEADADEFRVTGLPVIEDGSNLAVRALGAVRQAAGRREPALLSLEKRIPVAAGLAGGSADAAAVLGLASLRYGLPADERDSLAPALGSDVPFCLVGGTCLVEGHGDLVTRRLPLAGFAAAVVVPPFTVLTAAVYQRWDDLGAPDGPTLATRDLPPVLREGPPAANDLLAAALSLMPALGDWLGDLRHLWGRGVMMSGSGPALFAFFSTVEEATAAVAAVPGAAFARACLPVPQGWRAASGTLP